MKSGANYVEAKKLLALVFWSLRLINLSSGKQSVTNRTLVNLGLPQCLQKDIILHQLYHALGKQVL